MLLAFVLAMLVVNWQTVALYTGITDRYVIWADEPGFPLHSCFTAPRWC